MTQRKRNARVLVIDQDEIRLATCCNLLAPRFTHIQSTSSLSMALELIGASQFDLVICDTYPASLPSEQILQLAHHQIPIVFLSAGQQADVIFKRFDNQSFFCLKKSASNELLTVICEQSLRCPQIASRSQPETPQPMLPSLFANPTGLSNIHSLY